MEEIKSLIQRAKKALGSAEILIKEEDLEASVSRSYYAMFYATEALLLTKNLKPSSHKGVITLFGEHFIKTGILPREMSKRLKDSFDRRLISDYSFTFEIDKNDARESLQWAEEFVKETENYLIKEGYLIKTKVRSE